MDKLHCLGGNGNIKSILECKRAKIVGLEPYLGISFKFKKQSIENRNKTFTICTLKIGHDEQKNYFENKKQVKNFLRRVRRENMIFYAKEV